MNQHQVELERFQREVDYYETHREELLARYPEQWVAIFNGEVAAADPDVDRLLELLEERHIPKEKAFVERVTDRDDLLILSL